MFTLEDLNKLLQLGMMQNSNYSQTIYITELNELKWNEMENEITFA